MRTDLLRLRRESSAATSSLQGKTIRADEKLTSSAVVRQVSETRTRTVAMKQVAVIVPGVRRRGQPEQDRTPVTAVGTWALAPSPVIYHRLTRICGLHDVIVTLSCIRHKVAQLGVACLALANNQLVFIRLGFNFVTDIKPEKAGES